jgi:hypothetical protein
MRVSYIFTLLRINLIETPFIAATLYSRRQVELRYFLEEMKRINQDASTRMANNGQRR